MKLQKKNSTPIIIVLKKNLLYGQKEEIWRQGCKKLFNSLGVLTFAKRIISREGQGK